MKFEVYSLLLGYFLYNYASRLLSRLTFPFPNLLPTLSLTLRKKKKKKRKCDKTQRYLK